MPSLSLTTSLISSPKGRFLNQCLYSPIHNRSCSNNSTCRINNNNSDRLSSSNSLQWPWCSREWWILWLCLLSSNNNRCFPVLQSPYLKWCRCKGTQVVQTSWISRWCSLLLHNSSNKLFLLLRLIRFLNSREFKETPPSNRTSRFNKYSQPPIILLNNFKATSTKWWEISLTRQHPLCSQGLH